MINVLKRKLKSNLGKDILITLISQLTIMLLALLVNKLLSNYLGVEGYGQYSIIKKSTSVLSFVMLGGMGIALPRYLAHFLAKKDMENARSTVTASFLLVAFISTIVLVACVLLIHPLSTIMVGNADNALFFTALLYAISITSCSFLYAYYRGANAFMKFGLSQVLVQVITTIGAFLFGANLLLLLNSWSVATLLYVLGSFLVEFRKESLYRIKRTDRFSNVRHPLKTLFRYGMSRMVGDFFLFSFAAFMLVYINQKMDLRSASFFAAGLTLTSMVTPIFSTAGTALLPYVSTSMTQNNFLHADKNIKHLIWGSFAVSILAILTLGFGMDFFIQLFFSTDFLPASTVSRILIVSILIDSIYFLLRNPIDAVSTFPWNTVNMFLSLLVLMVLFTGCDTLQEFAFAYLAATAVRAILSLISWHLCRKKIIHEKG